MALAQECLKDVFKTAFKVDLDIGLVIVLQTAGRSGSYNLHMHILHSSGGITPANKWRHISYIPYEILHRKWQFHLLRFLKTHLPPSPQLKSDIDKAWQQYPEGFVAYVQKGDVPPGGKGVAKYLDRYVVSPPISVRRRENYNGKEVSYWYHAHKTRTVQHETIPALKFIGRMVQHILGRIRNLVGVFSMSDLARRMTGMTWHGFSVSCLELKLLLDIGYSGTLKFLTVQLTPIISHSPKSILVQPVAIACAISFRK